MGSCKNNRTQDVFCCQHNFPQIWVRSCCFRCVAEVFSKSNAHAVGAPFLTLVYYCGKAIDHKVDSPQFSAFSSGNSTIQHSLFTIQNASFC